MPSSGCSGRRYAQWMVIEIDVDLADGRTLHTYDTRTAPPIVSPFSGTVARRTSARLPSPFSRPPPGSASAGCRMTGPDMADQPLTLAGRWHQRPLASPASPMRSAPIAPFRRASPHLTFALCSNVCSSGGRPFGNGSLLRGFRTPRNGPREQAGQVVASSRSSPLDGRRPSVRSAK
jgi:hypothetical protein